MNTSESNSDSLPSLKSQNDEYFDRVNVVKQLAIINL